MILNYYEKGRPEDPIIVFIHGSASDASVWLNELTIVASKGYYCLALDLRGHGETRLMQQPKEHMKIDIDSHLQDVMDTLTHLKIFPNKKITMVTHSFGGIVAVTIAENYPDFINKLILTAMPPQLVSPVKDFLKFLLGTPLEIIQKNLDFFQKTSLRPRYKSSIMTNAHVLQEIYKHVRRWTAFKKIPRLKCPIFLAAGRFDFVAPSALIYRLFLATPVAKFELFKWSGHAIMEDEPEKFKHWLLKCIETPSEKRSKETNINSV